ncbi:MAG TPA: hypothetical protein VJU82_05810 [Acidobacteriaceae bacterium]|nr:hypothetical protein [Acidobacteriaceae bacterium]
MTTNILGVKQQVFSARRRSADLLAIGSIFAVGMFVYGTFAASLGFYWDDWPVVWVWNAHGPHGIADYFAGQRPAYGWIVAQVARMIGIAPLGWQVLSLAVRCSSSAVLFVAFVALWPSRRSFAWMVAVLVLLYPGFTLQPIALGFLEYHVSFLLFVVSLTATIFSITKPRYRWPWMTLSLATEALSYIVIEYFVGLEVLRACVILFCSGGDIWTFRNVKRALMKWTPYVVLWAAYLFWRTFIFHVVSGYGPQEMSLRSDVLGLLRHPVGELLSWVFGVIHNILMSVVFAWARPFAHYLFARSGKTQLISWFVGAIVAVIGILVVTQAHRFAWPHKPSLEAPDDPESFRRSVLLLGCIGLIPAAIPFAIGRLYVQFGPALTFDDRFTLPLMLPASLLLAWLITLIEEQKVARGIILAIILFGCGAYQTQNCALYRRVWLEERSLFCQIAWRAPVLRPGTALLVDNVPHELFGNHSAGTLDLLYDKHDDANRLDYFIFDLTWLPVYASMWSGNSLSYAASQPLTGRVRSFVFQGSTSQSVVAWISPVGTFRVVSDPYTTELLQSSMLDANLSDLSRPDKVITDNPALPPGPLLNILGTGPRKPWLYFYQKAELDRQLGRWGAIAQLGDQVADLRLEPNDISEWFPLIEGYAMVHRYTAAAKLSRDLLNARPDALLPLKMLWSRVERRDPDSSADANAALGALRGRLNLQNP